MKLYVRFCVLLSLCNLLITFIVVYVTNQWTALKNEVKTWKPATSNIFKRSSVTHFSNGMKQEPLKIIYKPSKFQAELRHRRPLPFCDGLMRGDTKALQMANGFMKRNSKLSFEDGDYISMTRDCKSFINQRGYITKPLSEEELNFPIAFSIVTYQNVEQTERLLRAIYMPQNIYCIHYDATSSDTFKKALKAIADCFGNVFIASNIADVKWGMISILDAEMNCLRDLIKYDWKYFINLTGQEMPLRSNAELVKILKAYNGANDIEGTVKNRNTERFYWVHRKNMMTQRRKGPPPHGLVITKGSVHVIICRGFAEFALFDQRAIDLYKWLENTGVPDESFFSTLNHNPKLRAPGSYKGIPETHALTKPFLARFKNWSAGPFYAGPCHGYWLRDICVLGIGDLAKLPQRREHFVNKFNLHQQYLALDCAEEWQYNKTLKSAAKNFTFDTSYFEKLSFVRNKVS